MCRKVTNFLERKGSAEGKGGSEVEDQGEGHSQIGRSIVLSADRLLLRRCSRQHDFEGGEGARAASSGDSACMEFDNSFDNGQAKP